MSGLITIDPNSTTIAECTDMLNLLGINDNLNSQLIDETNKTALQFQAALENLREQNKELLKLLTAEREAHLEIKTELKTVKRLGQQEFAALAKRVTALEARFGTIEANRDKDLELEENLMEAVGKVYEVLQRLGFAPL